MSLGLLPVIGSYSVYTLVYDCHKGWYSYALCSVASVVYALGFALMTPQVSERHLGWHRPVPADGWWVVRLG
jgi:hypothetical protein|eukprot:SAG25_NODE_86_length_16515_cov_5.529996_16_plen_72_part_00